MRHHNAVHQELDSVHILQGRQRIHNAIDGGVVRIDVPGPFCDKLPGEIHGAKAVLGLDAAEVRAFRQHRKELSLTDQISVLIIQQQPQGLR